MLAVLIVIFAVAAGITGWLWGRNKPVAALRPAVPYLLVLVAAEIACLEFTAHERKGWWFVPPLICLAAAVWEFIRLRKLRRTGH